MQKGKVSRDSLDDEHSQEKETVAEELAPLDDDDEDDDMLFFYDKGEI